MLNKDVKNFLEESKRLTTTFNELDEQSQDQNLSNDAKAGFREAKQAITKKMLDLSKRITDNHVKTYGPKTYGTK